MSVRSFAAALLIGSTIMAPMAFAAVTNGNYSGTAADGTGISMTVTTDTNTGKPQITSFGLGLSGACKPTGTINTGWGFNPGTDFMGDKAHFTYSFDYLYTTVALTVSGSNVTGTIASRSPVFGPYTSKPSRAVFCNIPVQTFSMTYQGSSASTALSGAHLIVVH